MALIEVNWAPSPRELRQFAGIWFPAFWALVGGLFWYHSGSLAVPAVMWGVALAVGLAGLISPALIRPIYVAWMLAAYPVGWVVSHLMLATIYFVVMAPVGLVMRLFGYDPMKRDFDRSARTYWVPHDPGGDTARYFRQF
jgi:hypothetical protein